jgi:hypothetical protein
MAGAVSLIGLPSDAATTRIKTVAPNHLLNSAIHMISVLGVVPSVMRRVSIRRFENWSDSRHEHADSFGKFSVKCGKHLVKTGGLKFVEWVFWSHGSLSADSDWDYNTEWRLFPRS